jgi:sodium/potassium-transporting ATPase subunit alpha
VLTQLSIIAKRMAKRNVYMKELDLIETFGGTTIIASDKTGTLTKNVMTVSDVWCVRLRRMRTRTQRYRFNDIYIAGKPDKHRTTQQKSKMIGDSSFVFDRPFADILVCMAVCNKASISTSDNDQGTKKMETVKILGNPSEAAMLRYVVEVADAEMLRAQYEIIFEVRYFFDTSNK